MEEGLNKTPFNVKEWLTASIDSNRPESLEIQLTELNFNLKLTQNELESAILSSKESLEKEIASLHDDFLTVANDYEIVDAFLQNNLANGKMHDLVQNQNIFEEIREKHLYKTRISQTLSSLEKIISLDYHINSIKTLAKEQKLQELEEKILGLEDTFIIISKLPIIDPLREKIEKIADFVEQHLQEVLFERFKAPSNKSSSEILSIFKIFKILRLNQKFIHSYEHRKLDPIVASFTLDIKNISDVKMIIQMLENCIEDEIAYQQQFLVNGLNEFSSHVTSLLIIKLLDVFVENIFSARYYAPQNNQLLELFSQFLQLASYIFGLFNTIITVPENRTILSKHLANIIFADLDRLLKNETKNFATFMAEEFEVKEKSRDELEDLLLFPNFNSILEALEQQYHHINETTFSTKVEQWTLDVQKIIEVYIEKFLRNLKEFEGKALKSQPLDKIHEMNVIRREKNLFEKENLLDYKLNSDLKNVNVVLEHLFARYEETAMFVKAIKKLDSQIRVNFLEDVFQNDQKLMLSLLNTYFEKFESKKSSKLSLKVALKNGLILFEQTLRSVAQVQEKIKEIVLKILITDTFNKLLGLPSDKCWSASEEQDDGFKTFIVNQTEYATNVCQNFFLHLQNLEDIHPRVKDLDDSKVIYSEKLLEELNDETLSSEIIDKARTNQIQLAMYWVYHYACFMVKVYLVFLYEVENLSYVGAQQMKADVEYVVNVLNNFKLLGRSFNFDPLLKILKNVKKGQVMNLKTAQITGF